MAIAIGLGYAAGHILITTFIVLSIMLVIYFWLSNRQISNTNEYNLVIKWVKEDVLFEDIEREILSITDSLKLIRFDNSPQGNTLVMLINPNKETSIDQISSKLKLLDKDMEFTFFEAKTNW